jgi:phage baseplate assembly protein V
MADPTVNQLLQRIKSLESKINNTLSRGKLNSISNGKTATAQVGLMAEEVYDGVEYPQHFGFISHPPIGSEVITAHFGGNRSHATILAAFSKSHAPVNLAAGESAIYNAAGSIVHVKANGDIEMTTAAGASINVKNDGSIAVNASGSSISVATNGHVNIDSSLVTINGDLTVNGIFTN